jgi:hypothetical protein
MVPRGGIEPSPIQLKVHHFLNSDFPVYLPVDPALSSGREGCDPVPPYPSLVCVCVSRYSKARLLLAGLYALGQLIWPDSNESTILNLEALIRASEAVAHVRACFALAGFADQFIAGNAR